MAGNHVFTSQTSGWVALECLRHLTNKLIIADYGNHKYEKDFKKEYAVGDRIEVKLPDEGTIRDGLRYIGDSPDRRSTNITVDQAFGADVEWDSLEKALQMERSKSEISEQLIEPRMAKVAQELDTRFTRFVTQNARWCTGALGTTPTALATYNRVRTIMMEQAIWSESAKKAIIITPNMMEAVASLPATQALFVQRDAADKAFKEGYFARYGGFDWFESMSLLRHTAGTYTSVAANAMETDGASQAGSSLLISCNSSDVFNKGDKFTIENVYSVNPMTKQSTGRLAIFTVTATTNAASSAATIPFSPAIVGPGSRYQNVDALCADNADLTFWPGTTSPSAKAGPLGIAISSEFAALVGVPLPMPTDGQELAAQKTDPNSGISVSIIREFNFEFRKWQTRIDVLCGFGILRPDACVLIGSAA